MGRSSKNVVWLFAGLVAAFGLVVSADRGGGSIARAGSWYENKNGGFGIYEPLGWSIAENGRSAELRGPERDVEQSRVFMGSDWVGEAKDIASLQRYAGREYGKVTRDVEVSELAGVQIGDDEHGTWLVLREPTNVIVIEYDLRGSRDQITEGKTALSSIAIRTGGIESR